jgi:delta 1-pyrroline-5-carboxylate dehydrogenase
MIVPRAKQDEAIELAKGQLAKLTLGDPFDKNTRLGPLASAVSATACSATSSKGKKEGATLSQVEDGRRILRRASTSSRRSFANVDNKMTIAQEEIFGPVLAIIPADSEADAIAIANDSPYGLAGGSGRHTRARPRGCEAASNRPGRYQWRTLQRAGAVRRIQEVGHRPRDWTAGHRGVLPAEVDPAMMFAFVVPR